MSKIRKKTGFGNKYKHAAGALALGLSLAPFAAPVAKADDSATTFPTYLSGIVNTAYTFDLNSVLGASGPFTVTNPQPTIVQTDLDGSSLNVKMLSPGSSTVVISNGTVSKSITFQVFSLSAGTDGYNVGTLAPYMQSISDADEARMLLYYIEPKIVPVNHWPASVVGVTYSVYYPMGSQENVVVPLGDLIKDPDNDNLTYSLMSNSSMSGVTASVTGATLTLSGTKTGDAVFFVKAEDGRGGTGFLPIRLVSSFENGTTAYYTINSIAGAPIFDLYGTFASNYSQFTVSPSYANGLTPRIFGGRLLTFDGIPTTDTSFVVTATDSQNQTAQATYKVLLNHNPSTTVADNVYRTYYLPGHSVPATTINLAEAGKYFTDPDGDPLTFSLDTSSIFGNITASISGSLLTYGGDPDGGVASFVVNASDNKRGSDAEPLIFTFAQNGAVEPFVTKYIMKNKTAGTLASVDLFSNFIGADYDTLTLSIDEANSSYTGYSPSIADGELTLTATGTVPAADAAKVVVKAEDGKGYSTEATYMFEDFAQAEQIDISDGYNYGSFTLDIVNDLLHADTNWTYTSNVPAPHYLSLESGNILDIVPSSSSTTDSVEVTATDGGVTEKKTINFERKPLAQEIADTKNISPGSKLTLEQLYKRYGLSPSAQFFARTFDFGLVQAYTEQMNRNLVIDAMSLTPNNSVGANIGVVGLDPVTHQGVVDTFTTSVSYGYAYNNNKDYLVSNPYISDSIDQGYNDGANHFTKVVSDNPSVAAQIMISGDILDFSFNPASPLPYNSTFTVYSYYADGTEASSYQVKILNVPPV